MTRKFCRAKFDSVNPNASWINGKGFMLWYILVCVSVHLVILSIPIITTGQAWTLTCFAHSAVTFQLFHWSKGSPVPTIDSENLRMTQWEQCSSDGEFSYARALLVVMPIIGFYTAVEYNDHDNQQFWLNLVIMLFAVVPKMVDPGLRLFGLNKY